MVDKEKVRKFAKILLIFGAVQYIVIIVIAMFFYPGGSHIDPSAVGYTFFGNYFSDLGRTVAINGISNPISSILYYIANVLYGVSLIPYFIKAPSNFKERGSGKIAGIICTIFGILAGLGTLLYAITPLDTLGGLHDIGVYIGYLGTFLSMIFLGIAYIKKSVKLNGWFLVIGSILFLVTLIMGLLSNSIFVTMLMQKTGKYLTMVVWVVVGLMKTFL